MVFHELEERRELDGVELEVVGVAKVVARALAEVLAKLLQDLVDLLVTAQKVRARLRLPPGPGAAAMVSYCTMCSPRGPERASVARAARFFTLKRLRRSLVSCGGAVKFCSSAAKSSGVCARS